ncbi:glycosyltransferase family 2 protein [soil metagenome]
MTSTQPRSARPTVVLGMLTYKRPEDLQVALPALIDQIERTSYDTSILVVDNDPAASAMSTAEDFVDAPVRFVHEPTPGIATARNRVLAECAGAEILIFIDDDERPEPDWLQLMVETWRSSDAVAVVGPVISTYPEEPEPWIVEGGFFNRRRLRTGTEIEVAATNNLLLDMDVIRSYGLSFDLEFGASGGSDTLFTREIRHHGGTMVWCDEAIVVDVVPMSRLTRKWVLQRALRTGNSWSRTSIALCKGSRARLEQRLRLTGQGLARIAGGVGRLGLGFVTRSVRHQANGARTLARGVGMTTGAWGYTYVEYRRKKPT